MAEADADLHSAQQAQREALQAEQESLQSSRQGLAEVREAMQQQTGAVLPLHHSCCDFACLCCLFLLLAKTNSCCTILLNKHMMTCHPNNALASPFEHPKRRLEINGEYTHSQNSI